MQTARPPAQLPLFLETASPAVGAPRHLRLVHPVARPPAWSPGSLLARVRAMAAVPDEHVAVLRRALAELEDESPSVRRDLQRDELELALAESLRKVPASYLCASTPSNTVLVVHRRGAIAREYPDDLGPEDFE